MAMASDDTIDLDLESRADAEKQKRERQLEYHRRYYRNHTEQCKQAVIQWQHEHRDKISEYNRRAYQKRKMRLATEGR